MGDWIDDSRINGKRTRVLPAKTEDGGTPEPSRPVDVVRSLQTQAGNAAVATLLGSPARATAESASSTVPGVQRAPATPGSDELMKPEAASQPTGPGAATPSTTGVATSPTMVAEQTITGAPPVNEALSTLFRATVILKISAAVDAMSEKPPQPMIAFRNVVDALTGTSVLADSYKGRDELLAAELGKLNNGLLAIRVALEPKVNLPPASDDEIAKTLDIVDANASDIVNRLH